MKFGAAARPLPDAGTGSITDVRVPDTSSALYRGTVRHRRRGDVENAFEYGVYQLLLNLDELPRLASEIPILGHNGPNLTSFHDGDHMGPGPGTVREKLARWLRGRDRELGDGPVLLLTNLRVAGYVFNPVSWFYCCDRDGGLRFVVAEVSNTFGETYPYLLDDFRAMGGRALVTRREKAFHVSPFIEMERIAYDWILTPPGSRLTVHMDEYRDGRKFFDATLNMERRPLTTGELARALVRYPHMTARTIFLIHWQALRLWLGKGAGVHHKPPPPENGLESAYDRVGSGPVGKAER